MKSIVTIQHTQSVHHGTNNIGSWTDWELSEFGRNQAENIGRRLAEELRGKEYKIFSSDLLRARQTAEPLAGYMGVAVMHLQSLREINLGEAVGKTKEWASANTTPGWSRDSYDIPEFAGAETWREFWKRVSDVQADMLTRDEHNIILVSHGITLNAWYHLWIGSEFGVVDYNGLAGGVSFYQVDDHGNRTVIRLNDASYMV
ncbi:MAG: phosphoglycerate mutase family protein [Symbiobacteriaceae bacterium]|nr:phosphoglycerate mutase family protein [Symbiobacteriaceae bacterium]